MKNLYAIALSVMALSSLSAFNASATTLTPGNALCDVMDMQITSVTKQDGSFSADFDPGLNATACLGSYRGNDSVNELTTKYGTNLGLKDVGFLNNTSYFPDYGAFVDESDLQDLKTPGEFVDPGWIFVGKKDFGNNGAVTKNTRGTISKTIDNKEYSYTFAEDLFSISFGNPELCIKASSCGTWSYTPPKKNPETLMKILGANKFFDQAAVVFKSGTQYAIYNFRLSDLGLPPVLGTEDANYAFSGIWNMYKTLTHGKDGKQPPGLSHVSLWLRDPSFVPTQQVPEPTSLLMFALGVLGLRFVGRKHALR